MITEWHLDDYNENNYTLRCNRFFEIRLVCKKYDNTSNDNKLCIYLVSFGRNVSNETIKYFQNRMQLDNRLYYNKKKDIWLLNDELVNN
jgi:hypothetical protein